VSLWNTQFLKDNIGPEMWKPRFLRPVIVEYESVRRVDLRIGEFECQQSWYIQRLSFDAWLKPSITQKCA